MEASAAVLVGGHSRRMGHDKAMLLLDGVTLLERTVTLLSRLTDDVLLVGRTYSVDTHTALRCVEDVIPDCGPLGGIATALRTAVYGHVIVVACDLPFLNIKLLEHLLALSPAYQATVPRVRGRPQPVHSVYSTTASPIVEAQLKAGRYRVNDLLPILHVRWVDESEIDLLDPHHASFRNANTVEDWQAAQREVRTIS